MFDRGYIKSLARRRLSGNIGAPLLVCLIGMLLGGIASSNSSVTVAFRRYYSDAEHSPYVARAVAILLPILFVIGVISILYAVFIGTVIGTGVRGWFLRFWRGEEPGVGELFAGFRIYLPCVKTGVLRGLYTFLWTLLFIIPGVVKSYAYSMADYIIYENPNLPAGRALQMSSILTDGYKGSLFVFDLSFIGWNLLSAFTCGILGVVYVNPYRYTAHAGIYDALKDNAIRRGALRWEDFGQYPPPYAEPPAAPPPTGYTY